MSRGEVARQSICDLLLWVRETTLTSSSVSSRAHVKSLIRPLFYNCLTLIVIFTLCLYGLGVVGLYLRWFVLEALLTDTPTPIIVTVVLPTQPGDEQPPIIITVIATRAPDHHRPPTATLEPTPTQWWPAIGDEVPVYGSVTPATDTPTAEVSVTSESYSAQEADSPLP